MTAHEHGMAALSSQMTEALAERPDTITAWGNLLDDAHTIAASAETIRLTDKAGWPIPPAAFADAKAAAKRVLSTVEEMEGRG